MGAELHLIPVGSVGLRAAFEAWWQAIRPGDDDLLADRAADLEQAGAAALGTGDVAHAERCSAALRALRTAAPAGCQGFAAAAAQVARQSAVPVFMGMLARGDLVCRLLRGGREFDIDPAWWRLTTFEAACRQIPKVYLDAELFEIWLNASSRREPPSFKHLVDFFRDRLPPEPALPHGREVDIAAAQRQFGDISRDLIRDARREAYGARMLSRGRPKR